MRPALKYLLSATLLLGSCELCGADAVSITIEQPFQPFTGKITRNKVRLRLNPSLEAHIISEYDRGDMISVVGEKGEFFAVKPPEDFKAYIFRTYILDGVVEGNHVNVRLHPDLGSPVIARLNSGERVEGVVSPMSSKWLEISPPEKTVFYVCREYVEKVGDANMMARHQVRRQEVNQLLSSAYAAGQEEIKKSFQEIDLAPIQAYFQKIIEEYDDFSEQVARARELNAEMEEAYAQMKLAYLEQQAKTMEEWKAKYVDLEQRLQASEKGAETSIDDFVEPLNDQMRTWKAIELAWYNEWIGQNNTGSMEDFYNSQKQSAVVLKGMIEPYVRNIKNKPGDFLLLLNNRMPNAFLYSTKVNLAIRTGQEVTVLAVPRPNNNFAYPAYFVLSVQ